MTSRISAVALALSIAFGFVGGAGSTQRSAKDQNLSGTIASSKRMADGKEWTTANLNVNTSSSHCYDDAEPNCRRYGRLYTWESAQRGCQWTVSENDPITAPFYNFGKGSQALYRQAQGQKAMALSVRCVRE
jgi:hypothetical protein